MTCATARRSRRTLAPALGAALGVVTLGIAGSAAEAADVRLTARDGLRVAAAVPKGLEGQRLAVTVDGERKSVVRRPATFSVRGLRGSADGEWHRLELRGRKGSASAQFMVGRPHSRRSPTLVLTHAPARTDAPATATFRYDASAGAITCTVDGAAHPCSKHRATVTAGPGRHTFGLTARTRAGRTSLTRTWTVAAPGPAPEASAPSTAPAPPAADPAPGSGAGSGAAGGGGGAGGGSGAPAGWRLLVSDDFGGSSLNAANWYAYGPRWPGNGGNGIRDTSAVSVGGGYLTITAQMVGGTLVSGAVGSLVPLTYGRIDFRVRTDPDPSGATSAVGLTWPVSNNWPTDGEIDIYETGTSPTNRSWFSSFVHYTASNQQYWFGHTSDATQWHDMTMEWTPDAVRFYRDGVLEGNMTDPAAIPRVPHRLSFQLDAFKTSMTGSVRMQVDDVEIYARG